MADLTALIDEAKSEIFEGLRHLDYSHKKALLLGTDISKLTSEDLETWEGLVARFGRVSDIYLSKYLRTCIMMKEPGFRGSFRDLLDLAEKFKLIDSADFWAEVRELRNTSVHEYSRKKLPLILDRVRELTPELLLLQKKV